MIVVYNGCRALQLLAMLAFAGFLMGACDEPGSTQGAVQPLAPSHSESDGFALSANGELAAIALIGRPVNEILVVNLTNNSATRVSAANDRLKLAHPALSPDGRHLAFVATPPTYFGIGNIWILDLETEDAFRLGESDHSYAYPEFSQDGTRLLYLKERPPSLSTRPGELPPQHRSLTIRYGLAEFELSQRRERAVSTARIAYPCGLDYALGGNGAYLCASAQWSFADEDQSRGAEDVAEWGTPQTFFVSWENGPNSEVHQLLFENLAEFERVRFEHTTVGGELVLSASRRFATGQRNQTIIVAKPQPSTMTWRTINLVPSDFSILSPRLSRDERILVGFQHLPPSEVRQEVATRIIIAREGSEIEMIDESEISIAREIRLDAAR